VSPFRVLAEELFQRGVAPVLFLGQEKIERRATHFEDRARENADGVRSPVLDEDTDTLQEGSCACESTRSHEASGEYVRGLDMPLVFVEQHQKFADRAGDLLQSMVRGHRRILSSTPSHVRRAGQGALRLREAYHLLLEREAQMKHWWLALAFVSVACPSERAPDAKPTPEPPLTRREIFERKRVCQELGTKREKEQTPPGGFRDVLVAAEGYCYSERLNTCLYFSTGIGKGGYHEGMVVDLLTGRNLGFGLSKGDTSLGMSWEDYQARAKELLGECVDGGRGGNS
jgi:hypothetical protein